jgi:hypothetical protein
VLKALASFVLGWSRLDDENNLRKCVLGVDWAEMVWHIQINKKEMTRWIRLFS